MIEVIKTGLTDRPWCISEEVRDEVLRDLGILTVHISKLEQKKTNATQKIRSIPHFVRHPIAWREQFHERRECDETLLFYLVQKAGALAVLDGRISPSSFMQTMPMYREEPWNATLEQGQ